MVLPWRTLIFAHTEECRPWRTLIFAHMILSCSGDSEPKSSKAQKLLGQPMPRANSNHSHAPIYDPHMRYFKFFVQGFTRVSAQSRKTNCNIPLMLFDFSHISALSRWNYRSKVRFDGERQRTTTRLLNRRRWSPRENDRRFRTRRIARETSATAAPKWAVPQGPEEDGARRSAMWTRRAAQTFWGSRPRERAGHAIRQSRGSAAA